MYTIIYFYFSPLSAMKAIVTIGKMIVNSITQQATGREETAFLIDLELPAQYWALSKY